MPDRRRNSPRWFAAALAAIVLLAVGSAVYFGVYRSGPSAEVARQLVQEKNVALGYLENQKLDDAAQALTALGLKVPRDSLPPHNLAIARALALGDDGVELTPERLAAATAAL